MIKPVAIVGSISEFSVHCFVELGKERGGRRERERKRGRKRDGGVAMGEIERWKEDKTEKNKTVSRLISTY